MNDTSLRAIGEVIRSREASILKAVGDDIKSRIKTPKVTVTPSVPEITVHVDMKPVADAIAAMSQAMIKLLDSVQRKRKITITHDDGTKSFIEEK